MSENSPDWKHPKLPALSLLNAKPYNGLKTAYQGIRRRIAHLGFRALGSPKDKVSIKCKLANKNHEIFDRKYN